MILREIADYVTDRISSSDISIQEYVTTDSILQNKVGRGNAQNLPPTVCTLTHYRKGDVLVANIRPYLKKIWYADMDGGCSSDVLAFRAKDKRYSDFLYAVLMQDAFFDYVMKGAKGSTMPRGDKNQIMRYQVPTLSSNEKISIGTLIFNIDKKIRLNAQINHNLEAMAKQLYDYWFVQFDFPDENRRPYKSSGGKMVWNEKLKRKIPDGWIYGTLLDIATYTNGIACQRFRQTNENMLPVIKIKEMHDGFSSESEYVKADIPEAVKVYNGDVLFSWSASLEVMLWAYGEGGLNQHIFKVTSKNNYPKHFYFYQLIDYIGHFKEMAEARKTTMGHITQDHLQQSTISLPPSIDIPNMLEAKMQPIFDKLVQNSKEIANFTKLRDQLLPLLMNGQVSVNYDLSQSINAFQQYMYVGTRGSYKEHIFKRVLIAVPIRQLQKLQPS
jgi:type I restriction enzyme S subunit